MRQLHITHLFRGNCLLMRGNSYLACPASAVAPSSPPDGGQSLLARELFKVFASSRFSCFRQTLSDPERISGCLRSGQMTQILQISVVLPQIHPKCF